MLRCEGLRGCKGKPEVTQVREYRFGLIHHRYCAKCYEAAREGKAILMRWERPIGPGPVVLAVE